MPSKGPDALWSPDVELVPVGEYNPRFERPALGPQTQWAFERSPFWRRKLTSAGLTSGDLASLTSLDALPFVEKGEILADQVASPPFGEACCVPLSEISRIHRTSGTTGRPQIVVLTARDADDAAEAGARAFWCAGVRPDDVVVHCLSYCMWSGGVTDHLCLERTGAAVIPFGVGNSSLLLQTIETFRPTSISCTPTYLNTLADLMKKEGRTTPADTSLRVALCGGEPGLQDVETRRRLETTWGIRVVDANYGMADVLSIFGSECSERNGLHFHGQEFLAFELVDPETLRRVPIQTGAIGEIVLTTLRRQAQPLFRLRSHDMARIISVEPCACGRSSFRFVILGRSDDMVVVRGVNFFPESLRRLFSPHSELTGNYQVVLRHPPPYDSLDVEVAVAESVPAEARTALAADLERRIQQALSVRVSIAWVEAAPSVSEHKTSRLRREYAKGIIDS